RAPDAAHRASSEDAREAARRAPPSGPAALSADAGRFVDVRIFAEVRHDLFGEELHHLERLLVARTGHSRAENAGAELVREDPQLVADGGRAAVDQVAFAVRLVELELAGKLRRVRQQAPERGFRHVAGRSPE